MTPDARADAGAEVRESAMGTRAKVRPGINGAADRGPANGQARTVGPERTGGPGAEGARSDGRAAPTAAPKAEGTKGGKPAGPDAGKGGEGSAEGSDADAPAMAVSTSPHATEGTSVERVMYLVILALMFPTVGAVYFFGMYAVLMIATSVLACILVEYLAKMLRKQPFVMDGSAVVTGLLLALVLPPRLPLWAVAIGAVIAIAIAKEAFGGLGHNIFNPALVGRAFLTVSFAGLMTEWVLPVDSPTSDAVAGATPLGEGFVREGSKTALYWDMFVGNIGGSLGETSAMLILMGGLLLVALRVINWRIPLFYIGTVAVLMFALGEDVVFHVLAGGLMLGAFFMATDYVTSPLTDRGKMIFATSAGALVVAIRMWGSLPEGVAFSILIMNGFTPLIDRYTVPRPYGYVRPAKKEAESKEGGKKEEAWTKEGDRGKEAGTRETGTKKEAGR